MFQLEKQNCAGEYQRDRIGHNERNIADYDSVGEPEYDSDDENREHHQGNVFCRPRTPRFYDLRQECSRRAKCRQEAHPHQPRQLGDSTSDHEAFLILRLDFAIQIERMMRWPSLLE